MHRAPTDPELSVSVAPVASWFLAGLAVVLIVLALVQLAEEMF